MGKRNIRKPIVEYDIVDGKEKVLHYFGCARDVFEYYANADPPQYIWLARIYDACTGLAKWAKKHRFRYATPDEIAVMSKAIQKMEEKPVEIKDEEITPNFDDWLQPIEFIPPPDKFDSPPLSEDTLSPFERMLQKKRGE